MKKELKKIILNIQKNKIVTLLLTVSLVCILLGGFLGIGYINRIRRMTHPIPRQTDVNLISGWMTIPYVARSYRVSEREIFQYLSLDPQTNRKSSIDKIAKSKNIPPQTLLNQIKNFISSFKVKSPQARPAFL